MIRVGWRAKINGAQTINDATDTVIPYATVVYDTHGFATSSSRFTVPAGLAGVYAVDACAVWTPNGGGTVRRAEIRHYNSGGTQIGTGPASSGPNTTAACMASYEAKAAAGDYFEVWGYQDRGGTNTVADDVRSAISGARVG